MVQLPTTPAVIKEGIKVLQSIGKAGATHPQIANVAEAIVSDEAAAKCPYLHGIAQKAETVSKTHRGTNLDDYGRPGGYFIIRFAHFFF